MVHNMDNILPVVSKPSRYLGREWNSVQKNHQDLAVTMVLAFPDTYELGMSNLGQKILYHVVNLRPDAVAERVFAPWVDMEEELRRAGQPLASLESGTPLHQFDLLGFSLQYELNYTNVLNMLDLGWVNLAQEKRGPEEPLVVAGGPAAFNAEPLAAFLDLVVLGEGEEVLPELLDLVGTWKQERQRSRGELLRSAASIPGLYVPSLYGVSYWPDGTVAEIAPREPGVPERVYKRVVVDLDRAPFSTEPVVPYMNVTHDRAMLELFRGCARGCRFCQAGMIYRPVRERSAETLLDQARCLLRSTGYGEMGLTSLSSTDYSRLGEVLDRLEPECARRGVQLSLPSLRVDSASVLLAARTAGVRKGSLTMALEAATRRLRDVVNKQVGDEELEEALDQALVAGWQSFKLYFMLGLPTETDEDVAAIARLARKLLARKPPEGRRIKRLSISLAGLVPKPHTPLQWLGQVSPGELDRRARLVRQQARDRRLQVQWQDARMTQLEAVLARGDRRLEAVLRQAWHRGARFDGWSECFQPELWDEAFLAANLDPAFYTERQRRPAEVFPWDHLSPGLNKEYLWEDYQDGLNGHICSDCSTSACNACGVCSSLGVPLRRRGGERPGPAEIESSSDQRF